MNEKYLEVAREIFTSDSDWDIRNRAFFEVYALIGNCMTTRELKWQSIRADRKALVFGYVNYAYDTEVRKSIGTFKETKVIPLNDTTTLALQRLSTLVHIRCNDGEKPYPEYVFTPMFHKFDEVTNRDPQYIIAIDRNSHIAQRDYREIIDVILGELKDKSAKQRQDKIQNSKLASELQLKIGKTKARLELYEHQLEYVLRRGVASPKRNKKSKGKLTSIDQLGLNVRTYNALRRAGFTEIEDLASAMENRGEAALYGVRQCGDKTRQEVIDKLTKNGYVIPTV